MADQNDDGSDKDEVWGTIAAVMLTAVFGLFVFFALRNAAIERYDEMHDMGTCIRDVWFGRDYEIECPARGSDLSWGTYIIRVLIPTLLYLVTHPVIGKLAVDIWNLLGAELASTIGLDSAYFEISTPNDRMAGSLWPIFVLLIPLQLIGLLIAKVYRAVWF